MDKKGVALLIVISTVAILTIFMVELSYKTNLYIKVSSNYKSSVQAYYLAQSSVNIALTRLAIYNKLKTIKFGKFKLPEEVFDMIWRFPFIYPFPDGFGGEDSGFGVDKDIKKFGSFQQTITAIDDKFNINSVVLGDDQEKVFMKMMEAIYDRKAENDDKFAKNYTKEDFISLANNIMDWIDLDGDARNGGDENTYYMNEDLGYLPRNGPIPDITELKMVEGMNSELFKIISDNFSVFSSSIDPNSGGVRLWSLLLPDLGEEDLNEVMKEKRLLPTKFTSEKEIKDWLYSVFGIERNSFNPLKIPLSFKKSSFKILAKGLVGKSSRSVVCYVSDEYTYFESYGFLNKKLTKKKQKVNTGEIVPKVVLWELE